MVIKSASSIAGFVLGLVAVCALPDAAQSADQKQTSLKVGNALTAAKDAVAKKQFDVAAAKIKEAEAEKKSPYDQFMINEINAFNLFSQRKFLEAASIYEKSLEPSQSQFLTPDQADTRLKTIAQFYAGTQQAQQLPKVIDFSKRWLKNHPTDVEMLEMLSDAYFRTSDFRQSRDTALIAISVAEKDGKTPKENWLLFVQNSAMKLDDSQGALAALEKLVRYHSKPDYWSQLLTRAQRNEKSDEVMVGLFRLQREVGALKKVEDYVDYTQMTMDIYPAEALRIVEAGFDKKVLGQEAKDKDRHQRLLTGVKTKAETGRARLAQLESGVQSNTATTGQLEVDLGLEYFSYETYDKAISFLEKGIKKGGLKNADEARIALGIAYLRKGQRDQARTQFKAVDSKSPMDKVANLWMLRT